MEEGKKVAGKVLVLTEGDRIKYDNFMESLLKNIEIEYLSQQEIKIPQEDMKRITVKTNKAIWVKETDKEFWFWRPGLNLYLHLGKWAGKAQLSEQGEWPEIAFIAYFYELLRRQGLLLHASGVVQHGKAYLFPGPSGAGKTTIVSLLNKFKMISADTLAIILGDDGRPMARSLPLFRSWAGPIDDISAPISGFYFPFKDRFNRVIRLSSKEALSKLIPCVWTFSTSPVYMEKLFDLSLQLVELIPGYALHFLPEPDFWEEIERAES